MSFWVPKQMWKGEDAYVVGGGRDSLLHFDWELLRGRNTIGCNSAYVLGSGIIKIVIFGDHIWWKNFGPDDPQYWAKRGGRDKVDLSTIPFSQKFIKCRTLEEFGGLVVGCSNRLHSETCPWLLRMPRNNTAGLGTDSLGWGGNTGALAINLALILGAKRVFLLGFDMRVGKDGLPNWHHVRHRTWRAEVYQGFIKGMSKFPETLEENFPGCEIWNVNDKSELKLFPMVKVEEHFEREGCCAAS